MKNIFVINAHWNNHGDEAAIRAMIDELKENSEVRVAIQILSGTCYQYEYNTDEVELVPLYPRRRNFLEAILGIITKGKIVWSKNGKLFFEKMKNSDLVIHAPGGPSIGDLYKGEEILYWLRLLAAYRFKVRYFFYAPSAGPFKIHWRNFIRKILYKNASGITFREDLSKKYFEEILPNINATVTLDAAFQHDIDVDENERILKQDKELSDFLNENKKIVGLTITDLQWHPKYSSNEELSNHINEEISKLVEYLVKMGYKVIFIPQLFGEQNDYDYMKKFEQKNCYTMSEKYNCYFQQYIISKIYAVIGMRYHSNIFAAKMGTPFISISYEQKMKGFINKIDYNDYCLDIHEFNAEKIIKKFVMLIEKYEDIQKKLKEIKLELKAEAYKTTLMVFSLLKK